MKFFLNSMLVVDLAAGTAQRMPLPEDVQKAEDTSLLAALFPADVVIAAGRLSGSYAPSSCVVTARTDGQGAMLKAYTAPALRRCGLDAIVLKGHAASPCALVLDEERAALVPADASAEVPALRASLEREAKCLRGTYADSQAESVITGPAAFAGSKACALTVGCGTAARSAAIALAFAARNVAGICMNGTRSFLSPVALDDPARATAKVQRLCTGCLGSLLKEAKEGFAGKAPAIGRSLACHGCTAPCGFWMKAENGHVACTGIMGLSVLLEAGASAERVAAVLGLSSRFGLDPEGLAALASGELPASLDACVEAAAEVPAMPMDLPVVRMGEKLGVCPFYMKRFPEAGKHLAKYQD
ncbi:MAG: hypothetical protein IJY48_03285 [Mailhella sp.]|nr:hypothetical protein [Mailhella sp.]